MEVICSLCQDISKIGQLPPNPRQPFLKKYIEGLRSKSTVRSTQRIILPRGRNATWVADTYFQWLPRFSRPFVLCEVDANGTCPNYNRFPRLHLLTFSFKQEHSSPDRRMYFITGGFLAKGHDAVVHLITMRTFQRQMAKSALNRESYLCAIGW